MFAEVDVAWQDRSDMRRAGQEPHSKPRHLVGGHDAAPGVKAGGRGRHERKAIAGKAQEQGEGEEEAVRLCKRHTDDYQPPSLASLQSLSVPG